MTGTPHDVIAACRALTRANRELDQHTRSAEMWRTHALTSPTPPAGRMPPGDLARHFEALATADAATVADAEAELLRVIGQLDPGPDDDQADRYASAYRSEYGVDWPETVKLP